MRLENPHPRRCAVELRKSHPAYHVIRLQPNDVDVPRTGYESCDYHNSKRRVPYLAVRCLSAHSNARLS